MKIAQIYEIVNDIYGERVEGDPILAEDLSNIVDVGRALFDSESVDKFVAKLCDRIGRVVISSRPYSGAVPSLLMDSWEFGCVKEKITIRLPEASENSTWDLVDGEEYSQDIFKKPDCLVRFFDRYVTFEVTLSIADKQVKSAFANATQLNSFISGIYESMATALTVRLDSLIESTINNLAAATIHSEFADPSDTTPYNAGSGVRAVNVLYLYNHKFGTSLTRDQAITTPEFIRFANYLMNQYKNRLSKLSKLFNIEGIERFTPADRLHTILLAEYAAAAKSYLYSDSFNRDDVTLDFANADIVPYWQGTGSDYSLSNTSRIDVEVNDGNGSKYAVDLTGLIGVMFDVEAAGVSCLSRNMTMHRNDRAEFQNVWEKTRVGYFNDFSENCVCFFMA